MEGRCNLDQDTWKGALRSFFALLFQQTEGYLCIAQLAPRTRELKEHYFKLPVQMDEAATFVTENYTGYNIYFCPQLFNKKERKKENIEVCTTLWADLDTCTPDAMAIKPNVVLETSIGRFQAFWTLEDRMKPITAESLSRKIAYYYSDQGADRSGWDLTQLLRVPGTINYKHSDTLRVEVKKITRASFRESDFDVYPDVIVGPRVTIPMPNPEGLPQEDGATILEKGRTHLRPAIFGLFSQEPEAGQFKEGWSGALWKLIMLLFEAGFDREQVFVIARDAKCNKYMRDGRPEVELWNDVVRGYLKHQELASTTIIPETVDGPLLTDTERALVAQQETFVTRYINWASKLGDAAVAYHQAGAFVVLSALLASRVTLPTSFGSIVPNLWFMILGPTTVTRKTTAMEIAVDLLLEVDPDAIVATDGSIEGLLQGLSMRPGRASIFLRDEFSGLLEAITKKDYMAGMAETLTKLYDGKYSKRILRRETIEIRDPILILFAGGIGDRIQQLLTLDHVASGFMPRFVYISAEPDISKVRPMGPPIVRDLTGRQELLDEMNEMYLHYNQPPAPGGGIRVGPAPKVTARLTPEAWERFNQFEMEMLKAGHESERPDLLTPVFDRLGKSLLKAAILLAAAEQREHEVVIEVIHLLHAISMAEEWRDHAVDVINGVGKSYIEREIERILTVVKKRPGISRSALMQSFHMTSQQANVIFDTMLQRGLITKNAYGKATNFYPAGYMERKIKERQEQQEEEQEEGFKVKV